MRHFFSLCPTLYYKNMYILYNFHPTTLFKESEYSELVKHVSALDEAQWISTTKYLDFDTTSSNWPLCILINMFSHEV